MKHVHLFRTLAAAAFALTLVASPAMARDRTASKAKQEVLYPDTARVAPKLDLTSSKDQKKLSDGLDAVNEGDQAKAESLLLPLISTTKSKYAQALALQGLANLKYNNEDLKGAIVDLKKSLDIGVLPNDTYFQLSYELAQFLLADEQYQPALDTIAKWRSEGKKETADSYAMEANAYYRLEKYPEAIAAIEKAKTLTTEPKDSWNQILMASYAETGQTDQAATLAKQQLNADPNDATARGNAVSILVQAEKFPEAIQLLEKAKANGSLTAEKDQITLAKLYLMASQASDTPEPDANKAATLLSSGIASKALTANADNYKLLGQANEIAGNSDKAIDAYSKAAPLASDGEAAMRAGHLLMTDSKYSKAKPLLNQAISKGVKHMGTAYMLLAECERGLKNKPAAIAAMKLAAQQPETAAKAREWLKKSGAGQ